MKASNTTGTSPSTNAPQVAGTSPATGATSKSQTEDGFTQTFDKLAHLGTIEYAAANCSGSSDIHVAVANEKTMLSLLDEDNKRIDRQPVPLAAAEARLAVREMVAAEGRSGNSTSAGLEERARNLAVSAEWKDSSDAHLRQIINALDRDTCGLLKREVVSQ